MGKRIRYAIICKTIPEWSKKDNCLYTCSIGFSPELGLIRIYPLPISGMVKWGIYEIEVERNKRDTRTESWKLSSYSRKEEWVNFTDDCILVNTFNKSHLYEYAKRYIYPSISKMNKLRISIGFIESNKIRCKWDSNDKYLDTTQYGLFEDVELSKHTNYTKDTKEKVSRILFNDEDGLHNVQFNEWGIYEYQRKYGAKEEAFRFINTNDPQLILCGNMHNIRSKWIGLGIFETTKQTVLFS